MRKIIGKTLAAIPRGDSGPVAIYRGIGKEYSDAGERIDVYSRLGDVPAGIFVCAEEFPHGYEITCREC